MTKARHYFSPKAGNVPDFECQKRVMCTKAAYLLRVVQHAFSIFLLMVTHINIPDTPCAIFGSCDHLGGIWREC